MFNPLELKKRFVQSQIEKAFSDDIEKAKYQVGQPHPNNPNILWTEWAPGKFDWKSKNGKYWKNRGGSTQPSDVKSVTAKEFSKNKNAVVEMLKNCDSKTDSNGDKRYHCEFYALGKDRGSAWFKKSDIEAYLRSYDDAKITPIKSDNASKEQKFKQSFKDASDDVLQKVMDGKIQASSEEKKWVQDILDERKASDVKTKAAKKIIDLLKVASSKYTDISKVVAWKTDRGNYYLDYDGAETGITEDKDVLSDKDFENAGVKVEGASKSNTSSNDPRDKQAQEAGFKDYAELRAWQDYGTAKSLLKKKSTKDSLRKQLEDKVAKYEKEHADVIKRVAEKKGAKSKSDIEIDETTIDQAEYDSQLKQAKQVDDSSRSMAKNIIQGNIDKTKKKLQETISSRPGAKATIATLQKDLTKFISQKKAVEDAERGEKNANDKASGRAVYYKTLAKRFDETGKCESTDTLIGVYKNNNPSKNIEAARALRKYIMKDLNYRDNDDWTKTLNEYKKLRLNADKEGDRDAYKAYNCAYQAVKDRIAKDAKK